MHLRPIPSILLRILLVSCFTLSAVSCAPAPIQWNWTYADLRLLDPVDDTPTPSSDILALYERTIGFDLEIRIDLLDLSIIPDYDLSLRLTTSLGNYVISIPAIGQPAVNPSQAGLQVRLVRDPWLDTVTVRVNHLAIHQPFTIQAASFVPGSSIPADETVPVASDAPPPVTRAPLLLAFWNTFPVTTPAQALRRWDGAHSGPRGERHGLSHLIEGSSRYHIPIALLDLKIPASLAALNFINVLPQISALADQGLLILPDVAYGEPGPVALGFSRRSAQGFGLPASQFVYNTNSDLQSHYLAQFIPLTDSTQLSRSNGTRLIPLPGPSDDQATVDGPSLDVRKQLVGAAFSANHSHLVVLGGDLPLSTWGNFDMAYPTFAWLAAHPWIHSLTGDDLLTFPLGPKSNLPTGGNGHSLMETSTSSILATLRNAPENSLTDLAWQTWFMLTAPTSEENLAALRRNYLYQVGDLLAAASWADAPSFQAKCSKNINLDGRLECVLSTLDYFAILDPLGGRLSDLFYLDATGPHELVGPSNQFAIGLSDPSEWRPGLGDNADPTVISGAFSNDSVLWTFQISGNTPAITFTSPDGVRKKTFSLSEDGLNVVYESFGAVSAAIPLAVDPQTYYFSPVKYSLFSIPGGVAWGTTDGLRIGIYTQQALTARNFTDSQSLLHGPENPDLAYPAGHYLPFPLSVLNVQSISDINVLITVIK